jgi:hypothetical protein
MRHRPHWRLSVPLSILVIAACGGGGNQPTSPSSNSGGNSGSTCSNVGPLGSAKGTLVATINGTPFNGGVSTGNSVYTPIPPQQFLPTPHDFITIAAVCGDGSQISLGMRAGSFITPPGGGTPQFVLGAAGTTQIGVNASGVPFSDPQTQQPLNHIVQYVQAVNGAAAGGWFVRLAGGSGSITLNSVSTQAVSGSFTVTMVSTPNTGSTGTRTVNGTFNVTF